MTDGMILGLRHRLLAAGVATVAFHAAVFGVVEWRLMVAADAAPEPSVPMAVTVRLEQALPPQPELPAPIAPPATTPPVATPARVEDSAPESPESPTATPVRAEEPLTEPLPVPAEAETALTEEPRVAPQPRPEPVGATRSVGSGESAGPSIPTYETVRYTPPAYPEAARRAGQTGTVELVLTLNRRGAVTDVTIHRSSSVPELDRAAIRAAGTWRFPRGEDGRRSIHRIRFDLEETR